MAKAKAEAKKKAAAKKKKDDDDYNDDDDDDDDEYTALSRSMFNARPAVPTRPPVGSFDNCTTCKEKFTVVRLRVVCYASPSRNSVRPLDTLYNRSESRTGFPLH